MTKVLNAPTLRKTRKILDNFEEEVMPAGINFGEEIKTSIRFQKSNFGEHFRTCAS